MRIRAAAALLGFTVATQLPSTGCTDAQLQGVVGNPGRGGQQAHDVGRVLHPDPGSVAVPGPDPLRRGHLGQHGDQRPRAANGLSRRAQAVVETMKRYPPGNGVAYGLISFASDAAILTTGANGLSGFTTDMNQIITAVPSLSAVNGQTNYDGALSLAFQMLQADMDTLDTTHAQSRQVRGRLHVRRRARPRQRGARRELTPRRPGRRARHRRAADAPSSSGSSRSTRSTSTLRTPRPARSSRRARCCRRWPTSRTGSIARSTAWTRSTSSTSSSRRSSAPSRSSRSS